jgi:transposase
MDKDALAALLGRGLGVEQIAARFGKDRSTVSYWIERHGLVPAVREKQASRGGVERERLTELVEAGKSNRQIA